MAKIGVNLRVGEDAESAGSPGPSLGNVDKDDDDTASPVGRDPRWRGIEGDGYGLEGAEAMEPLAGRCSGAQELRHGGGAHEFRPHRRLRRGFNVVLNFLDEISGNARYSCYFRANLLLFLCFLFFVVKIKTKNFY